MNPNGTQYLGGNMGVYQPNPNMMAVRQPQPSQNQGNNSGQTVFPCVPVMSRSEVERAESRPPRGGRGLKSLAVSIFTSYHGRPPRGGRGLK